MVLVCGDLVVLVGLWFFWRLPASFYSIIFCAASLLGRVSVHFTFTFESNRGLKRSCGVASSLTSAGPHPKPFFVSLCF